MITTKQARREAKRLFRLCLVDRLLDEQRVRLVLSHLARASGRRQLAILCHLLRLARLYVERHTATVQSATTLPSDLRELIQTRLARSYGAGLAISFSLRPALIGGVRIQIGNDVYDGTIRSGLSVLEGE